MTTAVAPATASAAEPGSVIDAANVRARPNTQSEILAVLPVGTPVKVDCWTGGELVYETTRWLHLPAGGWIHSTLVSPVDVARCTASVAGTTEKRYTGKIGAGGKVYKDCSEAPGRVYAGQPGYGPHLDSDLDGIGCENK